MRKPLLFLAGMIVGILVTLGVILVSEHTTKATCTTLGTLLGWKAIPLNLSEEQWQCVETCVVNFKEAVIKTIADK